MVNDAVPMVFILSRIARIVDQKKGRKYIVIIGTLSEELFIMDCFIVLLIKLSSLGY